MTELDYLSRIKARIDEEGFLKTLQYGASVGADTVKTYLTDTYLDLKYSGRILHGNEVSHFKNVGANDVYHTDYTAMPLIFRNVIITPQDVLVDVGCGKGRVINYWLSQGFKNQIIGLEIDPDIASATARQFSTRPNVKIVPGDAIQTLPAEGTIYYFYNPFGEEKVCEFERRLREISQNQRVKIIYYNPKSLQVFDNPNWSIQKIDFQDSGIHRWGRLNKYDELAIITTHLQ